ncbi:hypothetical protein PENCOP_c026G04824 [Penicillium coprophilum]|uniref:Reverse transcriptase/retrotransposon-derived protein RNase H-like domain-containing protein n=1 Tax=Penicillium coprophilum TaxID=36646 RepID=A0A1V6U6W8_9EURO|nr:hypothetical protein PENCOP_c026G04824 [Penicillium coprophilum]
MSSKKKAEKMISELTVERDEAITYRDLAERVLGAVLTQYYEEDDFWHPAAYYSKTMQPIELNYEIHDKELLVIVRAL